MSNKTLMVYSIMINCAKRVNVSFFLLNTKEDILKYVGNH